MTAVDISDNPKITDAGCEYLYKFLKKSASVALSYVYVAGTKITSKALLKLNVVLSRNNIVTEVFEDLILGAFTRLFNVGEMAGECSGTGSDTYIEYATSDFCPTITNPEEQIILTKLFSKITIQQGYLHHITRILRETP